MQPTQIFRKINSCYEEEMGALSGRIVFVPLPLLYMQCVQNSASLGSPTGMGQFLSRALRLAQVQVLSSLTFECIVHT